VRDAPRRRALETGLWLAGALLVTLAMWPFREQLNEAHIALVYLLVVLGGSAHGGRTVGLALATTSFVLFNFFLLRPYHTLSIADPLDWLILAAFLLTGGVAAELLHRAQRAAALADRRALEIERLARDAEHVEALREADRLKDALLASVSHDLRTPLTSIRAAAAEMRAQGSEQAAIIEEEAERLNRFVTDLLDLSRIRAGALPVEPEINAADDLIGAALLEVRGLPGGDQVDVRLPPGEAAPAGRFDFVLALRALVNLLDNALRYAPAGEPVTLELLLTPDRLVLEVRDRGAGVAPADRERIFEPFYRGKADGRPQRGTGLGLAIARSLAQAQGGAVSYRPGADAGSVFTLSLPRWEPPTS
jgi:two-component system sensor histidine kinase KdpD